MDVVACELGEAFVVGPLGAVFDGHHIGQFGNAGAQLGAHGVAAIRVVPHRHADLELL